MLNERNPPFISFCVINSSVSSAFWKANACCVLTLWRYTHLSCDMSCLNVYIACDITGYTWLTWADKHMHLSLLWLQCSTSAAAEMPTWLYIRWVYLSPQAFAFILTLSTWIKAQLSRTQCVPACNAYWASQNLMQQQTAKDHLQQPSHIWTAKPLLKM